MSFLAPLFLLLAGANTISARPNPDGYIPTNMPVNTTTTNVQNSPSMFLKIFDSLEDPCTNQTATLYPNLEEIQAPNGSCVNANTINTDEVTCMTRFNDPGRLDLTIWNCVLATYQATDCNGPAVDINYQWGTNGWVLPNGGSKSFQFACSNTGGEEYSAQAEKDEAAASHG